jgi:formiminotetrahydrofolate cyclodeaminase
MANLVELSCTSFVEQLASKAPVPGGGGAAALVGALGTALGNMVGSLTVGKPKYAAVEEDILALQTKATDLQNELLELIDRDATAFEPLARAYSLPSATAEQQAYKAQTMETHLRACAAVPLKIMEASCAAIDLHEAFAAKGAAIALSDVGVGVILCKAALQGASLNVFINTKSLLDRASAAKLNAQAQALLDAYLPKADAVYARIAARFEE